MIAEKKRKIRKTVFSTAAIVLSLSALAGHYLLTPWGFYWKVSPAEESLRMSVVEKAQEYLGCNEADGSHKAIIDLYNSHTPLARNYEVQYTDSWCATFVSAISIQCGMTDILPTECGCERQLEKFQDIDSWEERDSAIPLPGDVIYYDWEAKPFEECTGWSDHVGIVVGTKWPFIKVIEGNRQDRVCYRYLIIDDYRIRGFGKPAYSTYIQKTS